MQSSWQVGPSAGGTPQMDRKYFPDRFNHGGTETRSQCDKDSRTQLVLTHIVYTFTVTCLQVYAGSCVRAHAAFMESGHHKNKTSVHLPQGVQTVGPTMHLGNASATREAPYR